MLEALSLRLGTIDRLRCHQMPWANLHHNRVHIISVS
ncbi:MAG: hypothetical protein WCB92_29230 [Mycobacterium sp.]